MDSGKVTGYQEITVVTMRLHQQSFGGSWPAILRDTGAAYDIFRSHIPEYNLIMKFRLLILLLLAPIAWAQSAPDMASAPHYRVLLSNDQVRVFAVSLRPLERTMARHDHDFLVVTLQDCEVVMWPEGASDITNFRFNQGDVRFSFGGRAIGIRNDRTSEYRNITVEFLDPKVTSFGYQANLGTWEFGASGINPPVDPHARFRNTLHLGAASVSDIQLLPRDPLGAPELSGPELLIALTDIDLKAGESERIRKSSGEVVWIPAGRKSTPMNVSTDPVRLDLVEFKKAGEE
jgi:hypothetical protein